MQGRTVPVTMLQGKVSNGHNGRFCFLWVFHVVLLNTGSLLSITGRSIRNFLKEESFIAKGCLAVIPAAKRLRMGTVISSWLDSGILFQKMKERKERRSRKTGRRKSRRRRRKEDYLEIPDLVSKSQSCRGC